jgi:hypothetical protein
MVAVEICEMGLIVAPYTEFWNVLWNVKNGMVATSRASFVFHLLAVTNELWDVRK